MDKLLSVIVPTYNMEAFLEGNLASLIINHGMDRLEVLVINDGSSDRSSEIAHKFEHHYPNVFKVVDKSNGNYGSCINVGLQMANGKYIKIMDADDSYYTTSLEKFLDFIEVNHVDLFINDYIKYYGELDLEKVSFDLPSRTKLNVIDFYESDAMLNIQMPSITYRTEILRKIGYKQTEGISYTDMEWCFSPISEVKSICYFDSPIYCYRLNRDGQTMDPLVQIKRFHMVIQSLSNMLFTYSKMQLGDECKQYYINQLLRHSLYVYRFYLIYNPNLDRQPLMMFDKLLKSCCPEAYEVSSNFDYRLHLPYKYVKGWRKHKRDKIPRYILFFESILDCVGKARVKYKNKSKS